MYIYIIYTHTYACITANFFGITENENYTLFWSLYYAIFEKREIDKKNKNKATNIGMALICTKYCASVIYTGRPAS